MRFSRFLIDKKNNNLICSYPLFPSNTKLSSKNLNMEKEFNSYSLRREDGESTSFYSFFRESFVDIPLCFQKNPSLKLPKISLTLKFALLSMNGGNLTRAVRLLSSSIAQIRGEGIREMSMRTSGQLFTSFKAGGFESSKLTCSVLSSNTYNFLHVRSKPMKIFISRTEWWGGEKKWFLPDAWQQVIRLNEKKIRQYFISHDSVELIRLSEETREEFSLLIYPKSLNDLFNVWRNLYEKEDRSFENSLKFLTNTSSPIFSYFVYKTSKTVWKFSRRKADRFFLMWKYIPPYKRDLVIIRWLREDLDKVSARSLKDRNLAFLHSLLYNPQNLNILKRKAFIHNYVFREYRQSLIRTFRTQK